MRKVRYEVAVSLDGFIAGPNGEYDWIPGDPEMDFNALYDQFDTVFVGRRTFELFHTMMPKKETFVFSRTLQPTQYPDVTIVHEKPEIVVAELLTKPGKDIWLYGGGLLFQSLLEAKLVDTVEVAVMPVLLGAGVPLFPSSYNPTKLELTKHRVSKAGVVALAYNVK